MRRLDGVYTLGIVLISRPARRVGLLAIVLSMLLGLAASSFQPHTTLGETGSASANRIWSSGAELQSVTAGVEVTGTTSSGGGGNPTIDTSTKRSGEASYRATISGSNGTENIYVDFANSGQAGKFWFRFYMRIGSSVTSNNTGIFTIQNSSTSRLGLRMDTNNTIELWDEDGTPAQVGSSSSALSTGVWYRIEMYVDSSSTSATAAVRVDGVQFTSNTVTISSAAIDRFILGITSSSQGDLYFDDIAVNGSTGRAVDNWPGEGRIVHMQPDADGSNTAWTGYPSNTNDYDDVDEITPNDDTDLIYTQTNNALDDVNLESATNAGIGANDRIKLTSVGVRIRPCGLAPGGPACFANFLDINWEARVTGGGNTETSGTLAINDVSSWVTDDDNAARGSKLTTYDLPGTSTAPWTVSDLNSAQVGVRNMDASIGFSVSTLWLLVEYVDLSGGRMISSGFELNSATAGMEVSAVTNTPAINSTTFRSGAYALETENGGSQEYARFYFESANTNNDYYLRAYMRIATALNNTTATVLSLLDTSNLRRAYIKLTTSNTLELFDEDGQIGSASSALSTGVWYRIELRMNTSPSAGSHVVDGKIDGTSFASASNRSIGTGVARIGLGINASDSMEASANTQGSLLWDDVALNKGVGATQNSWPGEGAIIHLRPDADDSTNTAWTNGFANVDEVTPNDGTDLVSETTSGDIDDYDLAASSIGTSDVVNLVSVGVRFRSNTATQEDFRVRLKDSSSGIAIESNTLSPASTTWTTNATADPKLYPLTAYTRPEVSTAWQDAQLDTAQVGLRDVLSGTGTVEVTAVWLLVDYSPPATITISGTCDMYDQTTDCSTESGSTQFAVAVNSTLQGQVDSTIDGSWSISGVTQPAAGDVVTVFINAADDPSNRAVAVTKYDGSGDISGMILYGRHLTIGSADNQTLSNADIGAYDNSVSGDADIFFDVSAGNDLTVDSTSSYTDEELYIVSGNTFRPASGGGADVTTVHVENDGTWTADSNTITVNGNWQQDGTFSGGTSSVTMNSTTTGRTLSGTMTGSSAFYDLTFNGSGGAWSFSAAAETDRDFIITNGTVTAPSGNLTVARNFTNDGTFTHNSGTVVLDTTTTATVSSSNSGTTFHNFTSTTATKTIQFEQHSANVPVFTFAGTFTITGSAGNLINLYSASSGTQWKAHFNANQYSVGYANIRDGGCDAGTSNVYLGADSVGVSNNDTCWIFPINRMWSGGAELQSATAQVETNFNDGSALSVNTTTKRSGEASWRVNPTSSNAAFNKYYVNSETQGKYWARFYIYVASAPNTEIGIFNFNGNATRISVRMNTDRSIELWNEEDNLQIGSASSALSASTWYRIELYHDTTTLSSTAAELRLNGSTVASGTANLSAASNRIQWGVLETAGTADLYFDDIAINGPSSAVDNWPGEGKIVHMQPNADGDNVAWTDLGGNSIDYDEIDEITPNDATDYLHSSSTPKLQDVNLESASSAGIGSGDTITLTSVGVRFRTCNSGGICLAGSPDEYRARIKASGGGTVEESGTISSDNTSYSTNYNTNSSLANLYPLTLLDLPGASATKWQPSDLDASQIGFSHITHVNGYRLSTMWLLVEYIPVTNVTGTCDQYDQTTDCTDDGSNEIKVAINGTLQSGSDATVDGSWSVGITQPASGDIITVFINGESTDNEEAVAVTKYDGTGDVTGVVLYWRHLTIGSADNQTLSNGDIDAYDNSISGDEDIFFDVSAGDDLTVDSLGSYTDEELYVLTGNTFRPASGGGADVTTVDVEIDGTWTADSNAISVGGSWQNDGTFTSGTSTATFTSTSTGRTLAGTVTGSTGRFNNLTFNGSGGGWSNSYAMEVNDTLTMTDGTLSGTNNITVYRTVAGTGGTISLTGGTFEQRVDANRNFGTTSGSTAWTFNDLTFSNNSGICVGRTVTTQTGGSGGITVSGILRIGKSGDSGGCTTTLDAGNRTWTLAGVTGDPFQILSSPAGNLTPSTSTFAYTGNDGLGNTTIQAETYNHLTINNASETFLLEGTTNADGNFTLTNGSVDTTSANNYGMTVAGDWTMASGTTFDANASSLSVGGNWVQSNTSWNTAATGSGTSTITLTGTSKTITTTGSGSGDQHFYNLTIQTGSTISCTASNPRFNVAANWTIAGTLTTTNCGFTNMFGSTGTTLAISGTATGTTAISIRNTPTLNFTGTISCLIEFSAAGSYTYTVPAYTYGGGLSFNTNVGTTTTYTLGSGTFTVTGNLGFTGPATSGSLVVDNSVNNSPINVSNNVLFNAVAGTGTTELKLGSSALSVGNSWTNSDGATTTLTAGTSTVTMSNTAADGDITSGGHSFYNLTIDDTGDDITITDALTVTNDLTLTNGDLNGTQNVTVNGTVQGTSGTITMTGGTFEQRVSGSENFGTTSGLTAWSFSSLTFSSASGSSNTITTQTGGSGGITVSSVMIVGKAGDTPRTILSAGNRTWTLSGTGGTPLQTDNSAVGSRITPSTSTFTYTGNNAGGNTTVDQNPSGSSSYYNLDINNSSETFVLEGATTVANDLTVTNGVLSTTGSNYALTVTRDLTLANTTGVGLTANGSTISVARHFSDSGDKYTHSTDTLVMAGTGTFTVGNNSQFYNVHLGPSGFTTTLALNDWDVNNVLTFNGGTVAGGGGSWIDLNCSGTCTPVSFASATTLNGGRDLIFRSNAASTTTTISGGDYGNWSIVTYSSTGNNSVWQLGGNITTTSYAPRLEAANGVTGSTFTTTNSNYSITSTSLIIAPCTPTRTGSWTVNLNDSVITLSSTSDSLYVGNNCGSHTLNLNTSAVTVSGNVKFIDGTGTIAVNEGTSDFTFTPPSSTSKTYTPNGQSLYNVIINGGNASAQVDLAGNADFNGNLTLTAGQLDTVSGSNYAVDVFDVTMNGTATIVANAATITVRGNWTSNTTWNSNIGTSTVTFTGTNKSIDTSGTGGSTRHFYKLTINSGASINVAGTELVHTDNDVNIQGTLNITAGCGNGVFYYGGTGTTLTVGSSGVLGGSGGCFSVMTATPTYSYSGTINVSNFRYQMTSATTIPAYTYGGHLYFRPSANNVTYTIGAGTMSIGLSWTNENTGSGTLTIDNSVNNTNFTVSTNFNTISSSGSYAFTMGSATYDINGNWNDADSASFTNGTSTVLLSGTSTQTVSRASGANTFYNLTITNAAGASASDCERTGFTASVDFSNDVTVTNNVTFTTANTRVEFDDGNTYTFNNINWNGQASGTRIYFRNSLTSGSWNLSVSGTQTAVSYINVSRSDASGGNTIQAANGTNTDCNNNVNWSFNTPGNPASLAQTKTNDTNLVVGAWTNETSVKFTATITDADSNQVQICVENADINAGFVNTETACGSLVASGSTATLTISGLTNGSEYHWQARSKDSAGYYSSWVAFGGNNDAGDPADRDYGVDTTACTYSGSVYDGDVEDTDAAFNDGSLEELMANWDDFSCSPSGLSHYDVSIGTTVGGTDILTWTNRGTSTDTTEASLNLRTNQRYYFNIRAVDNASNTSSVFSSNGQDVLPQISFTIGSTTITFANLNDNNNRSDSKTLSLTTSTNAYGGYVIRQYATGLLTGGANTIPMFQGGTYATPGAWPGSFCTSGSNCGYGYTSNDATIQGANKFSSGTLYAAFATAAFGDIVADHTDNVTGATGPVSNQSFTITHRVSVDALQIAKTYQTEVLYIVTGTF